MRNVMDLSGKVAVVTGGTRGIGFEIVKKYLQNGAAVVLFGSRQETVEKALAKLQEENAELKVSCAKCTVWRLGFCAIILRMLKNSFLKRNLKKSVDKKGIM